MHMAIDVKTLAVINLLVQLLLIVIVSIAVFHAKKRELGRHCTIMRGAVSVQVIAILVVMLPSMLGYIWNESPGILFSTEMLAHHLLGLAVVLLWIYINLLFMGKVRGKIRLATIMRYALALWILSLILGLHMYILIWGV